MTFNKISTYIFISSTLSKTDLHTVYLNSYMHIGLKSQTCHSIIHTDSRSNLENPSMELDIESAHIYEQSKIKCSFPELSDQEVLN